ncbi:MAG TPA: class I SAM-dependent methyltransferase [Solirubrobacteraceae bacterium]|nr:class I SAM-dependent methyltransferase [Solirubrobacteraceae bacterium]
MSRMLWRGRAESWDAEGSVATGPVADAVLARCGERPGVAVDLGCGSGQLTLPLAERCERVLAVDIDPGAIGILADRARRAGAGNLQTLTEPLERLDLEAGSVDLVVSNYALHHLRDADKRLLLERALVWLSPGGRIVIGDMMLGRGARADDRRVIADKVRGLARRGPGGWWRIAKNVVRFLLRFQERPLRPEAWARLLRAAGFVGIGAERVVSEAWVVWATRPRAPQGQAVPAPASCAAEVIVATPGAPPAATRARSAPARPWR